jgi:NADPH-dependent curcumin reductase CurA
VAQMAEWMAAGHLAARTAIVEDLLAAPHALAALFAGGNTGKLIVKL